MTLGHKGALASTSNAKVILLLRTAYVSFDYNGYCILRADHEKKKFCLLMLHATTISSDTTSVTWLGDYS